MKFDFLFTVLVSCICLLIGYAFYTYSPAETKIINGIGSFLSSLFFGLGLIALSFEEARTTINTRVLSGVFFLTGLVFNIVSSAFRFKEPTYIITLGLLVLVYGVITYFIARQRL